MHQGGYNKRPCWHIMQCYHGITMAMFTWLAVQYVEGAHQTHCKNVTCVENNLFMKQRKLCNISNSAQISKTKFTNFTVVVNQLLCDIA